MDLNNTIGIYKFIVPQGTIFYLLNGPILDIEYQVCVGIISGEVTY